MKIRVIVFILAVCSVFAVDAAGQSITAITNFKDRVIAGSSEGGLFFLENDELHKLNVEIKGAVTSLDATATQCFGVSSEGFIFSSKNGRDWTVFDFNGYYSDYYGKCEFVAVAIGADRVAVLGQESDGKPVLYTSAKGTVWAARELKYEDKNNNFILADYPPRDLVYNPAKDEFIVIFEWGKMMTVPTCSHCNKLLSLQ